MSESCMTCVVVPPALEDALVDWLLNDAPTRGFTCVPILGHGEAEKHMSVTEQIAGRVKRVQVQVLCGDRAEAEGLLGRLEAAFPHAPIR